MPEVFNPIITHLYANQDGTPKEVTRYDDAVISEISVDNIQYDFGKLLDETIAEPFNIYRIAGTLSGWGNTTPRDFDESKYYAGLTMDGYYNAPYVSDIVISQGSVSFQTSGNGYGLAFPVRVVAKQKYVAETKNITGNEIAISWYDSSGKIISYSHNYTYYIESIAPDNAYWGVVLLRGGAGTHTFEDVRFRSLYRTIKQPVYSATFSGHTIKWNQLITTGAKSFDVESDVTDWVRPLVRYNLDSPLIVGHKVLALSDCATASIDIANESYNARLRNRITTVVSGMTGVNYSVIANGTIPAGQYNDVRFNLFDLTDIYGEGNEPTTVAEFTKTFKKPYYPHNPGETISIYRAFTAIDGESGSGNPTQLIRCYGINLWDEEWEVGTINTTNGTNGSSTVSLRSKNYIPVVQSTVYYCVSPVSSTNIFYYDANYGFLSYEVNKGNTTFTKPINCSFIRFVAANYISTYTTYKNDICINISDPNINGTYYPYRQYSKLNGVNDVKDTLSILPNHTALYTKSIGSVDLGTLNWTYNSTNGVFYTADIAQYLPSVSASVKANILTSKYITVKANENADSSGIDKSISQGYTFVQKGINIKDSAYMDATTFKTAMSGTILYYEKEEKQLIQLSQQEVDYILNDAFTYSPYSALSMGNENEIPDESVSVEVWGQR